jgi:transcriptional/translational regulatory protein YebC/TACO1
MITASYVGKGSLGNAMEHAIEAGAEDVSQNEQENTFEVLI